MSLENPSSFRAAVEPSALRAALVPRRPVFGNPWDSPADMFACCLAVSVVDPMLDVWTALPPRKFPNYAAGTWGPKDADELLERDERQWRKIEP